MNNALMRVRQQIILMLVVISLCISNLLMSDTACPTNELIKQKWLLLEYEQKINEAETDAEVEKLKGEVKVKMGEMMKAILLQAVKKHRS